VLTGGSLLALFGFFGPLSRDLFAVVAFIAFAGGIAFIFMVVGHIIKTLFGR
jgi:hypothetical protein